MTRQEKYEQIRSYQSVGLSVRQIGLLLGLTESGVNTIINDPDGSKQKARRQRYMGTCESCGARTDGSNGKAKAPRLCLSCTQVAAKVWTREKIIEAIQTWAAEHDGIPPRAHPDWTKASSDGRFPPSSLCYQSSHINAPFASWNEAIEAAGFIPRKTGHYERTDEIRAKQSAAQRRRWARQREAA